jgi:probable HAF family extracellular repeat protein
MKSRTSICITPILAVAVTLLASLMVSTQLAAQEHPSSHLRYKLVVIETFGGPSSFSFFGQARSLNNQGTLVGLANTSTPDPNYPNFNPLVGQDPFIEHGFRWSKDELTDLGALPGVNSSNVSWVNDSGVAVGVSTTGNLDPVTGFPAANAVVWIGRNIFNLGTLEGGYESGATGINNSGQITGIFSNSTPDANCLLLCLGTQTRSFVWQNGSMQDIGTLGGPDAAALLINDQGQIAGISYDSSFDQVPFLWQKGKMVGLGSLGGTFGGVGWLNNRGQVVGSSNLSGDTTFHPYIWTEAEGIKDLGTLGGTFGFANWVNESGEVVGAASNQGDQALLAFLWKDGVMVSLGTLVGDPCSQAISINSRGQVVGSSVTAANCFSDSGRAFLWEHGGPMIDLNTFVPAGLGLTLTQGAYINDRGEILATGAFPDGDTRAVLLIPCDAEHGDLEDCQDESAGGGGVVRQAPASRSVVGATPHLPAWQRIGRFHIPQNVAGPRN